MADSFSVLIHDTEEDLMRTGTYETASGERVHVQRTESGGYRITHADGSTTMIGGSR